MTNYVKQELKWLLVTIDDGSAAGGAASSTVPLATTAPTPWTATETTGSAVDMRRCFSYELRVTYRVGGFA